MKKHLFSVLSSLLLTGLLVAGSSFTAQAKIWRVDNNGGSPGNFTTAQAAHNATAVVNNDTLYFNGSGTSYGALTMTKRLYIFGPGYFLTQNPQTQAAPDGASLSTLQIDPSAAGSIITGMTMGQAFLFASNTLFKRNYVVASSAHALVIGDANAFVGIFTPSNVLVVQNYIVTGAGQRALWVFGGCSNIIVTNNFLNAGNVDWPAVFASSSMIFSHNVLLGRVTTTSTNLSNCYLLGGNSLNTTGSGNSYDNNICDGTQFPAGSGNIQNAVQANVIVNTGSSDAMYKLKAGSPAIGSGVGGVDMGLYGGSDPYVLSGLPAIPAIWSISAPSSGSGASGLNVNIKAKSHN